MNVVAINTYAGSLLLGAVAAKASILATLEDCGFGSDLQALNFPRIPRYEKTEDWPDRYSVPWRQIDVIAHPPCASFSIMAARYKTQRGTESDGFECHRRVINYALSHRCRTLAIESVTGAYEGGREAYEELASQYGYRLTYVFLNAVSFNTPQWRPRVWMLFHKAKTFRVELKPKYKLLREVLRQGPTEVDEILGRANGHVYKLWTGTRKLLKGTHPVGHIYRALKHKVGVTTDEELQAHFPEAQGYVSSHVRFVDENWFSTTILGNTVLAYGDRLLSLEEYCAIMGFPRDYKWGNQLRVARTFLSKGVCPPIATWILQMQERNAMGWSGLSTHECSDFGGVIDLRVKQSDVEAALGRMRQRPDRHARRAKSEKRIAAPFVVKERPTPKMPRGRSYILVDETKAYAPNSPQAVFILAELRRAKKRGLTRAEVVNAAVKAGATRFPTNQPHDRAVGFWLSKLKGQGALEFAE